MGPTLLGAAPARTPLPWDSVTVPSVAPATVCHALTKAMIATVTGAKVVLEQARHDDACAWWLAKPRYATQAADLRVETGAAVRISLASSGITEARLEMLPGRVSVWLPENTALAGWRPGTKARQPFTASLRFTYPTGASPKQERAAEATAERTVTRLAEQIARLPDRSAP